MRLSSKQIFRIAIGVGLLAIVAYIYFPHLLFTYSVNAVISAPIVTIKSPIEGIINKAPPKIGTEVNTNDLLFSVTDPTLDVNILKSLEVEKASYTSKAKTLEDEISNLEGLQKELKASDDEYISSTIDRLKIEIDREKARHKELLAQAEELRRNYKRQKQLNSRKNASDAVMESAQFDSISAEQQAEQVKHEIRRLEKKKADLESGIFINLDDRTEVPYQQQRLHEISIRLGDVKTRLSDVRVREANIDKQIEVERQRIKQLKGIEIKASTFGVIWDSTVIPGSRIQKHDGVMMMADCTKTYIDITVNQVYYGKVKPGDKVKIDLIGSKDVIEGTVRAVRGGSLQHKTPSAAGVAERRSRKEIQVIIDIDEQTIRQTKGDFCHIGRNAKVRFA